MDARQTMPDPHTHHTEDTQALAVHAAHLREAVRQAPALPGVYTFHGQSGGLPLYIGKSVNLRARLLAHLRAPDEARMVRQTTRISHIRTAGEIGALLLEAQLIKREHPLFNQKLRRNRQLCALRLRSGVPEVVYAKDLDFAHAPDLFGLYASRHAALQALQDIADEHRLCHGLLGLEKLAPRKACFRSMVRRCAGACSGQESVQAHQERLRAGLQALRVNCWPYAGAVGMLERCEDLQQIHVLNHWCYLGSAATWAQARQLSTVAAGFDADGYRILVRPVLSQALEIRPL